MSIRKDKKSNLQQLKKSFNNVIQILIKWNLLINMNLAILSFATDISEIVH